MDKIEIKHNLTSRQFRLYDYLKNKKPDEWTTQFTIANDLREVYGYMEDDLITFHDHPVRHHITKDIRVINNSDYLPKPILSSSRGVKIANSEEFDRYIGTNINSAVNRLKRLKKLAEKGNKHNQFRMKLSPYQKELYESFIDDVSNDRIL